MIETKLVSQCSICKRYSIDTDKALSDRRYQTQPPKDTPNHHYVITHGICADCFPKYSRTMLPEKDVKELLKNMGLEDKI